MGIAIEISDGKVERGALDRPVHGWKADKEVSVRRGKMKGSIWKRASKRVDRS